MALKAVEFIIAFVIAFLTKTIESSNDQK